MTAPTAAVVTADELPPWSSRILPAGTTVWEGGVRVNGTLVSIPGRTLNVSDAQEREEVRRHALSVLAVLAHLDQVQAPEVAA